MHACLPPAIPPGTQQPIAGSPSAGRQGAHAAIAAKRLLVPSDALFRHPYFVLRLRIASWTTRYGHEHPEITDVATCVFPEDTTPGVGRPAGYCIDPAHNGGAA